MDRYASLFRELSRTCPDLELRAEEPMSRHTTFRIGGPVRLMALPRTEEDAKKAVRTALQHDIHPFYMGNGSDLLVSDQGYEGFIIKAVDGLGKLEHHDNVITAGSGVLLSRLSSFAMDKGLSGLEFAHGIPGSVGGAVTMNAGAYDGEMKAVVRSVRCLTARRRPWRGTTWTSPIATAPSRTRAASSSQQRWSSSRGTVGTSRP